MQWRATISDVEGLKGVRGREEVALRGHDGRHGGVESVHDGAAVLREGVDPLDGLDGVCCCRIVFDHGFDRCVDDLGVPRPDEEGDDGVMDGRYDSSKTGRRISNIFGR